MGGHPRPTGRRSQKSSNQVAGKQLTAEEEKIPTTADAVARYSCRPEDAEAHRAPPEVWLSGISCAQRVQTIF